MFCPKRADPSTGTGGLTARRGAGIVQGSMVWLRRSLVLVPVVAFLAAALLLSCGGGSNTTTTTGNPFSLMSVAICPGSPPTSVPTPAPTKGSSPTPTPTPQCTPTAIDSIAGLSAPNNTVQFNVQGTFQQNPTSKHKIYFDQTNNLSLRWNIQPGGLATSGVVPGQFIGAAPGCVCLTAEIAPAISCPVSIAVATTVCTPCPTPSPFNLCPGPTPTATPTKTP
jgi:hypothetical protein